VSKADKLLKRIQGNPSDFTWDELIRLLSHLGYTMERGGHSGGSRARFTHAERSPILLHKPHPALVLKRYQIRQLIEFLKEQGII